MNVFKQVITHAGQFHADEILAIAVMRLIQPNIKVIRKFRITPMEYNDPLTVIIDVGRYFEPGKNLYDHHQDKSLPASNLLVLDAFYEELGARFKLDRTESYRMYVHLMKTFFNYVSEVDKGRIREANDVPTFNSMIRNMNALDPEIAFELALTSTEVKLEAAIRSLKLILEGEKEWDTFEKVTKRVVLQEELKVIPNWKEIAKKDDIIAVIQPNIRGGWQVVSRDSNEINLPEDKRASFRHNAGFLIVFPEKDDAIDYASKLDGFYGTK